MSLNWKRESRLKHSLRPTLTPLVAGAAAYARLNAAGRATLARETAATVATAAAAWVRAAATMKLGGEAGGGGSPQTIIAEEMATGPLSTLRLLAITAWAWEEIGRSGRPRPARPPWVSHAAGGPDGPASFISVDVLPERRLFDRAIFGGHTATVRCVNPGSVPAFLESWEAEAATRPRSGGVAAVLGAGNVTGLAPADAISQVFEHGRAALLKLHPLHAPLAPVYREAFAPLLDAGLMAIVVGGTELAEEAIAEPAVTHVHLTGGQAAFDAVVWGGPGPQPPGGRPLLAKPITCELGNVTPWIVVPGRYTPTQLRHQADLVAASIANNTSFNCIATKVLVTCRQWEQRSEFLRLVAARLASLPARPAWFPGSRQAWEAATGRPAAADGMLPCVLVPECDAADRRLLDREWFVPVAAEVCLDAGTIETFCIRASEFVRSLPGSLAASVTIPRSLTPQDSRRADLLVEHLRYGVVAVNTWAAIAYAVGSVPWGGYPGGTLADPASGIGHVHDPLLLPLVHNSILRAPLATRLTPAWVPWHAGGDRLAQGVVEMIAAIVRGRSGFSQLARMIPAVLTG